MQDESHSGSEEGQSHRFERGRNVGTALGELLLRAEELERGTSPSADPQEWLSSESQYLLQWAEETGRLISSLELAELVDGFRTLEGGLEHQVFYRKRFGRIYKLTRPPYFGANWELKAYIQNLVWNNEVFRDDMRLEGVVASEEGVRILISQPYIVGRSPTPTEIEEWFEAQGASQISKNCWVFPNGLTVSDAHTGNLIMMQDGVIVPIDLQIQKLGQSLA